MARVHDEQAHARKRDAYLDVAQRLLESKGYGQMSVQDVVSETGASKGLFYYYFESKEDLVEAVMERTAARIAASLTPTVEDPGLDAVAKLRAFFAGLGRWKSERQELLAALLRVWQADENAIVRQKLRAGITTLMAPLLAEIIRQGTAEGTITARYPDQVGRVIVSLVQDLNDRLAELVLAYEESGDVDLGLVEQTVAASTDALERVLGLPSGSVVVAEPGVLRPWFTRRSEQDGDR